MHAVPKLSLLLKSISLQLREYLTACLKGSHTRRRVPAVESVWDAFLHCTSLCCACVSQVKLADETTRADQVDRHLALAFVNIVLLMPLSHACYMTLPAVAERKEIDEKLFAVAMKSDEQAHNRRDSAIILVDIHISSSKSVFLPSVCGRRLQVWGPSASTSGGEVGSSRRGERGGRSGDCEIARGAGLGASKSVEIRSPRGGGRKRFGGDGQQGGAGARARECWGPRRFTAAPSHGLSLHMNCSSRYLCIFDLRVSSPRGVLAQAKDEAAASEAALVAERALKDAAVRKLRAVEVRAWDAELTLLADGRRSGRCGWRCL
eukprot:6183493-Pleurochrysis_carterae.AAC.1